MYNARDLVCSVPRMMGFAHVGTPVELRADGSYAVQGELKACGNTAEDKAHADDHLRRIPQSVCCCGM